MKKILLFILPILSSTMLFAQNEALIAKMKQMKSVQPSTEFTPRTLQDNTKPANFSKASAATVYYGVEIGDTYYDLQSNGPSPTNITQYDDGSIAVAYINNDDTNTTGPTRGAGYAYFNSGTQTWTLEQDPNFGIFDQRVGWPVIGNSTSGEFVIAHGASPTQMVGINRSTKGSGTWSASATYFSQEYLWPKMAVAGDTIHLLGSCNGCPNGPVNGINNMMWYSRSVDGGQTFDIMMQELPGTDTSNFPLVPFSGAPNSSLADAYNIDVRGNTVAVVAGGGSYSLNAWKSVDGGANWTLFPVADREVTDTSNGQGFVDPATGNTRIFHPGDDPNILIDNNDQIHVFAGAIEQSWDPTLTWAGRAASSGIMYWNESMLGSRPVSISDLLMDINCDNQFDYLLANENTGTYGIDNGASRGVACAIDNNGNIFAVTSSIVEDTYDFIRVINGDSIHIRDIYMIYSTDGGVSWSYPINVASQIDGYRDNFDTTDAFKGTRFGEDVFPTLIKHVGSDNTLHMYYQTDDAAGSRSSTGGAQLSVTNNSSVYYAMDINTVLATPGFNTDSCELNYSTVGLASFENVRSLKAYPNPASDILTISIDLKVKSDFEVTITDLMGRQVGSKSVMSSNSGINQIDFDLTNLSSGVYIYKVNTSDKIYSNKFVKN